MSDKKVTNRELGLKLDNMLIQLNTINKKLGSFHYQLKEMRKQAQELKQILRNREAEQ
jgi:hypothetical protein